MLIAPHSVRTVKAVIQQAPCRSGQEIDRIVDAPDLGGISALEHARLLGSARQHHGIVAARQLRGGDIDTDIHARAKLHALCLHEAHPAVDDAFIELHIGDAVHEQSADTVRALKDCDAVSPVIELIRCCQSGRTAAHDGDPLAAPYLGYTRLHIAAGICRLYHEELIVMYSDCLAVLTVDARLLAQSRADPPGELREVAGLDEAGERMLVVTEIYLIVPLGDQVVQRTAREHTRQLHSRLAQRHAAVHAARALLTPLLIGDGLVKLLKGSQTLLGRYVIIAFALIIQKSGCLAHYAVTSSNASRTALSCEMPCSSYLLMAVSIL